jgi:hypothetical protein
MYWVMRFFTIEEDARLSAAAVALLLGCLTAPPAEAFIINFGTIPTHDCCGPGLIDNAIQNPYDGFNWNNVYVSNGISDDNGTTAIVSSPNYAYNGHSTPGSFTAVSGTFTLNSGYFTSRSGDGSVTVSDNLGDTKTFSVVETGPTFVTFGWSRVTTVSISGAAEGITYFDNVAVNGVPEPSTWALMALGFGLLGGAGYWTRLRSVVVAAWTQA